MSPGFYLIVFAVLLGAGFAWKHWYWSNLAKQLKTYPDEQTCFQVQLPHDVDNSAEQMARVLRTMEPSWRGGHKLGKREISLTYKVTRKEQTPELQVFIQADRDIADELQRHIKSAYHGALFISDAPDPLRGHAETMRPARYMPAELLER